MKEYVFDKELNPDRVKALVVDAEGAAKDVAAQGCERRIRRKRSSNDDSH